MDMMCRTSFNMLTCLYFPFEGFLLQSCPCKYSCWTSRSPSKFYYFEPCYCGRISMVKFLIISIPTCYLQILCLKQTKLYLFLATKTTHLKLGLRVGTKFGKFTWRKKLIGFDDQFLSLLIIFKSSNYWKREDHYILQQTTQKQIWHMWFQTIQSQFPAKLRRQ